MHIMGTGSRSMVTHPDRVEIYQTLEAYVLELYEKYPELVLITGMAEGWDEAIAKVGFRNGIPYIAAIPNHTYGEYYWGRKSKTGKNRLPVFNQLCDGAKEVIVVCDSIYVGDVHSNFIRNNWMVDSADRALVYNPSSRGTKHAVARLRATNTPYEVYPFSQRTLFD